MSNGRFPREAPSEEKPRVQRHLVKLTLDLSPAVLWVVIALLVAIIAVAASR